MPKFNVTVRLRVKADNPGDARHLAVRIVQSGVESCANYEPTTFKALKGWGVRGARRVRKSWKVK